MRRPPTAIRRIAPSLAFIRISSRCLTSSISKKHDQHHSSTLRNTISTAPAINEQSSFNHHHSIAHVHMYQGTYLQSPFAVPFPPILSTPQLTFLLSAHSIMTAPTPFPSRATTPEPSSISFVNSNPHIITITADDTTQKPGPKPPTGWDSEMTAFTRDALANGEDATSVVILLEAEWPVLKDGVSKEWVETVGKGQQS